jgi:hypothetical protein
MKQIYLSLLIISNLSIAEKIYPSKMRNEGQNIIAEIGKNRLQCRLSDFEYWYDDKDYNLKLSNNTVINCTVKSNESTDANLPENDFKNPESYSDDYIDF